MNPCRTRRRLRKGLGDWGNLFDHAVNADFSDEFRVRGGAGGGEGRASDSCL